MRVVGAAFGRTGTSSVRTALETLGLGPVHYMRMLAVDPVHARGWSALASGEPGVTAAGLLAGYRSSVAWPGSRYWRDLAAAFPDAKVLLTVRDPDTWYDSVHATLYRTRPARPRTAADHAIEHIVWRGTFGGRFADRSHAVAVYLRHNEEVRAEVPPDRLVECDPARGWEPLCAGLGVAVPDAPFPHVNTTGQYLDRAAAAGALPGRPSPRHQEDA
ncbi:hypothetical protein LX16_1755 [Stackebrandtia albiflava]|uniref:Sulfotransferase family protein n=1 Tax=Stackebrandtia albiflava TaxID=406432 RepID=A0A562VDU3_9ACTN|nr:sulfotransferase family protein [Stackebrandtia albiflava]TWJ16035.1 hypothetical protein LX16_1755 [Stackebrandtia albiflava]